MAGSSTGVLFTVTSFGESHGPAMGCVIDGCPAGLSLSTEDIAAELRRRRPGEGAASTSRSEADEPEILSGVFEGKTLGTPIAVIVRNIDQRSKDYDALKDVYRPGHADWTYEAKYGFRDHRGGGRSSGRETLCRVIAGAVAKKILALHGITIRSWTSAIAGISMPKPGESSFDFDAVEKNQFRIPAMGKVQSVTDSIEKRRLDSDSAGGIVSCVINGLPPGLGEPVFGKIGARLAEAMLSINAAKAVEFGEGFNAANLRGSQNNDIPAPSEPTAELPTEPPAEADGQIRLGVPKLSFKTNHAGGMLGGISTGQPVEFSVALKPVPSILQPQETVNREGHREELVIHGRHDVCIIPRAVPVVEAMAAIVIADLLLIADK
jgi:chorismate synthase